MKIYRMVTVLFIIALVIAGIFNQREIILNDDYRSKSQYLMLISFVLLLVEIQVQKRWGKKTGKGNGA
jgi:hypothetical protein